MVNTPESLYDRLAENYHLIFADWAASIKRQASILGPILERECGAASSMRVLDCACGIGTQLLGLAERGFNMTGSDSSCASVYRAKREASQRGVCIPVFVADMRDLGTVPDNDFDAVICMDNALPHLDGDEELLQALLQIRSKLACNKLFMLSIRDYDRLLLERPVVQGPAFYRDDNGRRIVHQIWDWFDDRHYTFHLYISRETEDGWETQHYASNYRGLLRDELNRLLQAAGFTNVRWVYPAETGFYQPIALATSG